MQLWYDSAIALLGSYPRVMKPGFPGGAVVKNLPANAGDARDTGLIPGSGRSPYRRKWQLTPVFLPGKSHGQRNLAVYSS